MLLVSTSPCCRALCALFFSLLGLVCASVKKFAQRRKNDHKLAFYGLLGEFFRGNAAGGAVLGEFCRGPAVLGSHRASCVAPLVFWARDGPAARWAGCCVYPLVFWAPDGPTAVCAGGRRPAREPSAPRASLGASSRSPARPRRRPPAPRQIPPVPPTPAVLGVLACGLVRRLEARPGPPPPTGTAARPRGRPRGHAPASSLIVTP